MKIFSSAVRLCFILALTSVSCMRSEPLYVNTFSEDGVVPTKSGWAYWFIPSGSVADTLSLKVSYVENGPALHGAHSHMHDEIFIALEGDVIVSLNGEETVLHPGDGMYAPSGSFHGIRRYDVNCPVKYFVINREVPGGVPSPYQFWKKDYTMADCHTVAVPGTFPYVTEEMSCGSLEIRSVRSGDRCALSGDGWQNVIVVTEGGAVVETRGRRTLVPAFSACYVPKGTDCIVKPSTKGGETAYLLVRTKVR